MSVRLSDGTVYLVGAGPGAADLITLRGLRTLRAADAVVYDALLADELLSEARPDAEVIYAGKRGYCVGSTKQEDINALLVELARAGKSVCRLKCGDPCIFGRGGEEAEALAAAGVSFEIVPGVTSAAGACASAGIPLTHRDAGQTITFVSGHHDPDAEACALDWDALARLNNVVFYMALRHLDKLAARLVRAGLDAETPAAVIESGTLPGERVTAGPLWDLPRLAAEARCQAPALIVVGPVVRYRDILRGAAATGIELDTRGVRA